MKNIILPLVVASLALSCCHKASADITLYNNGPISGAIYEWQINDNNLVSDTFTLTQRSIITSIDFGAANLPDDTISQIDWDIASEPDQGTIYGEGTSAVTGTSAGTSSASGFAGDPLYVDSFSTSPVVLTAGTYYLSLNNAVVNGTASGDGAYWDENDGPSIGVDDDSFYIGSESFDVQGTVVPEPSGLALLCIGTLFVGFFIMRRRKSIA